ncbi:Spy/CpxP family protein refolding chaperone [Bradyrhizobium sp.]|uniref:Spy/CpxP family protein refolding chaperone n=1 Tax=Bradyrhizobium sp. TaxID=376 RepID=UPI000B000CA5|nr:Spy/CpxP family protein refolding chaperone [Bradyrhizobium sp.]
MTRFLMTALAVAALTTASWAQTPAPAEHDSHHPAGSPKSEPAPANPALSAGQPGMNAPQGGMGGMPMMDMMKGMMSNMPMMKMMNMMESMQVTNMMGPGMGGMATIDRVEGRIAFLRAELKITDAQAGAWNVFADALRANARKLGEVRGSIMGQPGAQQPAPTMADRLDQQEQWLLARLEGTRAMKSAFAKLNETLSDDQRKTAGDLLAPHLGMGMMAMMGAQMQPGQMQPGQMGPGRMQPGQMGPGMMQPGQMQPPGKGNK